MSAFEHCPAVSFVQNGHRWLKGHLEEFANTSHRIGRITNQITVMDLVDRSSHRQQFLNLLLQNCGSQKRLVGRTWSGKPQGRRRRVNDAAADLFRIAPDHYKPCVWKLAGPVYEP